ncbi:MAG: HEAT repeat domain-containing protein [bacterium]
MSPEDLEKMDLTELIDSLKIRDREKRKKVLEEIKKRGEEVVPELLKLVQTGKDRDERIPGILVLAELKSKEAVPALEKILKADKDDLCREASVLALAEIGDTTSIAKLKDVLKDESGNVRQRAVLALAKLGDKSYGDIALKGIKEGNPTEKLLATMALEEIGDTSVIKELKAEELKSKDVWTKINAKLAIKKIEYRNTKEGNKLVYLKEALKDEQFEVNSWAVEELVKMSNPEAMKIIEETASDRKIAGSYAAGKIIKMKKR